MMLRMLLMTFTVASAIQMDLSPAHRVGRNATTLSAFSQLSESIDFGAGGDIIKTIINQFNEMIIEINKEKIEEGKKGLGQCTDNVAAVVTIAPADGSVTGCAASSKCQTDQTGYQTEATTQGNTITGLNAEIATLAGSITDSKKSIADAEAALAKVKSDQLVTDQDNLNDINKHNAQLAVLKKVQAALHENGTISMPESLLSVEEKKIIGNSRVTRPILLMVQALQTAKPGEVVAIKQLLAEIISRIKGIIVDKTTNHENAKKIAETQITANEKAIADKKTTKNAAVIAKAGKETDLVAPTKAKEDAENNIKTAAQLCVTGFEAFKTLQTGYDDEVAAIEEIIKMLGGLTFTDDTKEKIDSIALTTTAPTTSPTVQQGDVKRTTKACAITEGGTDFISGMEKTSCGNCDKNTCSNTCANFKWCKGIMWGIKIDRGGAKELCGESKELCFNTCRLLVSSTPTRAQVAEASKSDYRFHFNADSSTSTDDQVNWVEPDQWKNGSGDWAEHRVCYSNIKYA